MKLLDIAVALPAWALTTTACVLSDAMPSFQSTLAAAQAPAPPTSVTTSLRELGPNPSRPVGRTVRDDATRQTRVSLTTHKGSYFLWMQHPRVTFFYVFSDSMLEHPPATVFLVFLTHEPQAPRTNELALSCNQVEHFQGAVTQFDFEPGPMVTNRVYTYELPVATFIGFARCNTSSLRVGDIAVSFDEDQLRDLRVFAGGMMGVGN